MTDQKSEYHDKHLPLSIEPNGVILRRIEYGGPDDYEVATNVPHLFHHHAPTGFEWGYRGSGPADLAFVISEWFLRHMNWGGSTMPVHSGDEVFKLSFRLKTEVKRLWISGAPSEGQIIPFMELHNYFEREISLATRGLALTHEDSDAAEYWQFEEADHE
jgi:hypothetical protein